MDYLGTLTSIITILNILLAIAIIFLERRNIGATWAWLMLLLLLPGFGFVIYLLFGQNLSKRKMYKIKVEQHEHMSALIANQQGQFKRGEVIFNDPSTACSADLIYLNLTNAHAFFTQDNEVQFFTDGHSKYESLFADIERAKRHIHVMYYIVRDDHLGRRLIEALSAKAREGVEVRFLYDDIGSAALPRRFFNPLLQAGGHAAAFFPSRIPYLNFRLNYRNHRKLAIIDGKAGYIGGFNIGDEYLGLSKRFGAWRDTHLRIRGSSVLQMQAQFMMDWNLASASKLTEFACYLPDTPATGSAGVQIVASGPNNDREQIRDAYIKIIHSAKREIYLQSPYLIPDESMLCALKLASLSGVDVKIMIPAVPDHKVVYWASFSYLGELLDAGVKCYLYEKGFLHSKTIVADGRVASVGTANIDIRSFKLNFEVNAILYGESAVAGLKRIFEDDLQGCSELTPERYRNRSRFQYIRESITRLFSPIL